MAKRKKNYTLSFGINVHGSSLTKKQLEKIAESLVDELQASVDAELTSGITGDCKFNVDGLADPQFKPAGEVMTWQELGESISDQMGALDQPTDPRDPLPIRMSDGNPLTAAHLVRSGRDTGWEVWLSDAERL